MSLRVTFFYYGINTSTTWIKIKAAFGKSVVKAKTVLKLSYNLRPEVMKFRTHYFKGVYTLFVKWLANFKKNSKYFWFTKNSIHFCLSIFSVCAVYSLRRIDYRMYTPLPYFTLCFISSVVSTFAYEGNLISDVILSISLSISTR